MNREPRMLAPWTPQLLSVLRIATAFCFVQWGTAKYLGIPQNPMFAHLQPMSLSGAAGVIELVGGTLLLIGLFTRPVAFIVAGEMAFAYFLGHVVPKGHLLTPMLNSGEDAVLYCFIFLFLAAAGGGPWSVDGVRMRRTT